MLWGDETVSVLVRQKIQGLGSTTLFETMVYAYDTTFLRIVRPPPGDQLNALQLHAPTSHLGSNWPNGKEIPLPTG